MVLLTLEIPMKKETTKHSIHLVLQGLKAKKSKSSLVPSQLDASRDLEQFDQWY